MENSKTVTENWLSKAAHILKSKGIIKRDKDIADKTGYSPESISNMLSGKAKLSSKFKTKFEETFPDVLKSTEEGTPIYEISATASPNEYSGQLPEVPSFHVKIPGYEDCNFGMHVFGHSMYPTIETGSLVLCRKVKDKSLIMYGEIYLIRTEDYLMVKRLQKNTQKGYVLCTSDNFEKRSEEFKRFEPFDMAIDKIIDLYLVKGIIKKTQT